MHRRNADVDAAGDEMPIRDDRTAGTDVVWRLMTESDLQAVHTLSVRVHPRYPERAEVLAEKLRLFPDGCFVLARRSSADVFGYCFSHPWGAEAPPALDTPLRALPPQPMIYFIHDLTLDESMRGLGLGRALVPALLTIGRSLGLSSALLVAVEGRAPFWAAAGFAPVADPEVQAAARAKYGAGALAMTQQIAGA
jgi:GNAT superfamily N-acetyltransferase